MWCAVSASEKIEEKRKRTKKRKMKKKLTIDDEEK